MAAHYYDPNEWSELRFQAFVERWTPQSYAAEDHTAETYVPDHPSTDVREAFRFATEALEAFANEVFGEEAIEALEASEEFFRWCSQSLEVT